MASEEKDQSKLFQKVPSDDPYFKMNEVAQQMNNVPKSWMVSPSECSTNFDLVVVHILAYHYFQIRTCDQYHDEYKACKSYKGRLYQRYSKYCL